MIIWIILILSILVFISWLFISKRWLRYTLGILTTFGLIFNISLLCLNMSQNFGMEKEVTTKESLIYTASPKSLDKGMIITKQVGQNNTIAIFRDSKSDKLASVHYKPDLKQKLKSLKMSSYIRQNNTIKEAKVITKTTKWVYKNKGYEQLFDFDDSHYLISKKSTVYVPQSWVIVEK